MKSRHMIIRACIKRMRRMQRNVVYLYNLKIFIGMENNKNKSMLNEVVDVNGSKVFIENGEVRIVLSEAIQQSGYMSIEEAIQITKESVRKIYIMNNAL